MPIEKIISKIRNTNYIYVILIIGVAVMLLFGGENKKSKDVDCSKIAEEYSQEEQLTKILSQISGVGDVSVMITYYAGSEKSLAYESKIDKKPETSTGFGGEISDKKAVMSDGEPVVIREIYPEVKGVVVVAQGAENPTIKKALCEAVSTSLGIAIHKICVLQKTG